MNLSFTDNISAVNLLKMPHKSSALTALFFLYFLSPNANFRKQGALIDNHCYKDHEIAVHSRGEHFLQTSLIHIAISNISEQHKNITIQG